MSRTFAAARSLQRMEALPIIAVFALLLFLFMATAPAVFLKPNIYMTFMSTLPPLILLSIGLTFVIGAGEIDLSFPSVIAFSGFVFAVLFKEHGLGWLAVVIALGSGVLVGYVNGVLVAHLGIPSFIATLGTQFFWSGLATVLSGGSPMRSGGRSSLRYGDGSSAGSISAGGSMTGTIRSRCRPGGQPSSWCSCGSS